MNFKALVLILSSLWIVSIEASTESLNCINVSPTSFYCQIGKKEAAQMFPPSWAGFTYTPLERINKEGVVSDDNKLNKQGEWVRRLILTFWKYINDLYDLLSQSSLVKFISAALALIAGAHLTFSYQRRLEKDKHNNRLMVPDQAIFIIFLIKQVIKKQHIRVIGDN